MPLIAAGYSAVDEGKEKPAGEMVDRIAAVVDNEIILLSEVRQQANEKIAQLEKAAQAGQTMIREEQREKAIEQALDQVIDNKLVAQQAKEMELTVTAEEIDRMVANVARDNNIDVPTLLKAVKAQGSTVAAYRNTMRDQLMRYKVLSLKIRSRAQVSEGEARQFYNNQVRDVRATGAFEGAHILLRVPPDASTAQVASVRKRALSVTAQLDAGREFADLARELSEDSATAPHGGSLGMRQAGIIPKVLERAYLDLEVGETTGPIRTPAGFHIIRLNDRQALGVQSFSEVKDRIIQQLVQEEMARQEKIWLKELRQKTFIDIRI